MEVGVERREGVVVSEDAVFLSHLEFGLRVQIFGDEPQVSRKEFEPCILEGASQGCDIQIDGHGVAGGRHFGKLIIDLSAGPVLQIDGGKVHDIISFGTIVAWMGTTENLRFVDFMDAATVRGT